MTSVSNSVVRLFPCPATNAQPSRSEEAQVLRRLRSGERIDHYETMGLRKDKEQRKVSLTVSIVRDSGGRTVRASITERKAPELNPV